MKKLIAGIGVGFVAAIAYVAIGRWGNGPREGELSIVFANARRAAIDDCGCEIFPSGGVHREWNLIGKWGKPSVYLSGGTTFVGPNAASFTLGELRQEAERVADALARLGTTAVAPSVEDATLGTHYLVSLSDRTGIPFVSANLVDSKTKKHLLKPSLRVTAAGRQIVITALTAPVRGVSLPEGTELRDPAEALAEALKGAEGAVVILLAELGPDERNRLLEKLPRIHLVLGGPDCAPATQPYVVAGGKTLFFNPATGGRTISRVLLQVPLAGGDFEPSGALAGLSAPANGGAIRYASESRILDTSFDEPRNPLHSLVRRHE